MNRNAKIALGCGGAGCLGLIEVVIVVVVLVVTGVVPAPGLYNPNRNSNNNDNFNSNASNSNNSNSNTNDNDNLNSNSNSESSDSSSMSEDDKHRLYQAVGMTRDTALTMRVIRKIGLGDGSGADHQEFVKAHFPWAMKNLEFIQSVNTPEKARAYVEEHIDD
jgi:predicted metalloprotease